MVKSLTESPARDARDHRETVAAVAHRHAARRIEFGENHVAVLIDHVVTEYHVEWARAGHGPCLEHLLDHALVIGVEIVAAPGAQQSRGVAGERGVLEIHTSHTRR